MIRDNPDKYQSALVRLSGFTNDVMNDNNYAFVTIFDIMRSQNLIKKVDQYGHDKIGKAGHTFFGERLKIKSINQFHLCQ